VGAVLACDQGDHAQARQMLLTCLELRRNLGKPVEIAATLSTLSMALRHGGDVQGAAQREREALEIFRSLGDEIGEAIGLQHLGECAMTLDDDALAQAEFEQALRIARRIGHREIEAECELLLGEIDFAQARLVQARERFERSLAVCQDAADKRNEANALRWLGKADLAEGRLDAARMRLAQAVQAFHAFEMREELLGCLEDHAWLALARNQPAEAARLAAAVQAWRGRLTLDPLPREALRWQAWLQTLRDQLPGANFDAAWSDGAQWESGATMRAALSAPAGTTNTR
jgi:tetratricopeptide (TPR) repeat protein